MFRENWIALCEQQVNDEADWLVFDAEYDNLEEASSFGVYHDQPSLRMALYESDIGFLPLGKEYNFKGGIAAVVNDVCILHFGWAMPRHVRANLVEHINKHPGPRIRYRHKIIWDRAEDVYIYSRSFRIYKNLISLLNLFQVPRLLELFGMRERLSNLKGTFIKTYF